MPTATFLSRVSAANAFCLAICDPQIEGIESVSKPHIVHECQSAFQSIINEFEKSKVNVDSISSLTLQSFASEFERLCSDLNVHFSRFEMFF